MEVEVVVGGMMGGWQRRRDRVRLRFALTGHAFLNVPDHTHTVQGEDGGWVVGRRRVQESA